jgi:two-component system LytT family response regulator
MTQIVLSKNNKKLIVHSDDILYCEADGKYTRIVLTDESSYIKTQCLKQVESGLNHPGLCRVHRKYMINLRHLKEFRLNGENILILVNGQEIPLSIRRRASIMKTIKKYIDDDSM